MPPRRWRSVLFPDPEAPVIATNCPGSISTSTPRIAITPAVVPAAAPKAFSRCSARRIATVSRHPVRGQPGGTGEEEKLGNGSPMYPNAREAPIPNWQSVPVRFSVAIGQQVTNLPDVHRRAASPRSRIWTPPCLPEHDSPHPSPSSSPSPAASRWPRRRRPRGRGQREPRCNSPRRRCRWR